MLVAAIIIVVIIMLLLHSTEPFTQAEAEIAQNIMEFFKKNPDASYFAYLRFLDEIQNTHTELAAHTEFDSLRSLHKNKKLTKQAILQRF